VARVCGSGVTAVQCALEPAALRGPGLFVRRERYRARNLNIK